MNLLIWLIVGVVTGAITGAVMRTSPRSELLLNIVVGAVGALLGGCLLAPIFGTGNIDTQHYTTGKLVVAIFGALALLTLVNVFSQLKKR